MSKKLRGCLTILAVFIVGVIVIYYGARWGYYQGWWGQNNPVARYLWLCDAPPGFEQTLYPENVEILVPACENLDKLDHRTIYFTSDKQYLRVGNLERSGYWIEIAGGQVTVKPSHVQYLTERRREGNEWVTRWFTLDSNEIITSDPGGVILKECGRDYDFWEGLFSEDRRRIARYDGIYDATSGKKLLDYGLGYNLPYPQPSIHYFTPCLWLPDNQGLILEPGVPWGLELLLFSNYDDYLPHSEYPVPQPVLKFTVPDAYR